MTESAILAAARREEKPCVKCKSLFIPTPSQFRQHWFICKPCRRATRKDYVYERKIASYKKYAANPEVKKRKAQRDLQCYYDPKLRRRFLARRAVRLAKKKGLITQKSCCEICNKECKTQAHHWKGYGEEFWLDVQWICSRCHGRVDSNSLRESHAAKRRE